jgi:hypothetical protein
MSHWKVTLSAVLSPGRFLVWSTASQGKRENKEKQ